MFTYTKSFRNFENKCLGNPKIFMILLKVRVLKNVYEIEKISPIQKMFMN